jgi:hypothetical protein
MYGNEDSARVGTGSFKEGEHLLSGVLEAARMLRDAGCSALFIDGSFVTDKPTPGDWDGCFCTAGLDWSKVDPLLTDIAANRAAIKVKYKGEFFPADCRADSSGKTFREFFQTDRQGRAKGILVLELRTLP